YWKPQVFPTRADLDKIAPNNPLWLVRADGHGALANSAALRIAGITKETRSPFGGEIMKDNETGEPTGMLLDNAQDLIPRHLPAHSLQEGVEAVLLGAKRSQELGWTSLHVPSSSMRELDLLKKLHADGKLKIRVDLAILGPGRDASR